MQPTAERAAPAGDAEGLHSTAGLELGSFAADGAADGRRTLVVATYNIRYAVGSFLISGSLLRRTGIARPARRARLVSDNLRRASSLLGGGPRLPAADLVALQEADRRTVRAGGRHVARELAERLSMRYAYAWADTPRDARPQEKQWYLDFEERISPGESGDTGVALLSRPALADVRRLELPQSDCPWRPRLALAATAALGDGSEINVLNVHVDPHGSIEERVAQQRAFIDEADRLYGTRPTVILGDFNTLTREARDATHALLTGRGFTTPMPSGTGTWRAGLLRLHTDWIFVRGARALRWGVGRTRGVSDHWPVWAEIEVG